MENSYSFNGSVALGLLILVAICIYRAVMTDKKQDRAFFLAAGSIFAMNVLYFGAAALILKYGQ